MIDVVVVVAVVIVIVAIYGCPRGGRTRKTGFGPYFEGYLDKRRE